MQKNRININWNVFLGISLWLNNTGSGSGLVSSGNKPLPEPVLNKVCHHMVLLGLNELSF